MSEKFPEINQDLFARVDKIIQSEPQTFRMASWENIVLGDQVVDGTYCGTTRCIAGWGIHLVHQDRFGESDKSIYDMATDFEREAGHGQSFEAHGAELFGLTRTEASCLFIHLGDEEAGEMVHALATDPVAGRTKLRNRFHLDRSGDWRDR